MCRKHLDLEVWLELPVALQRQAKLSWCSGDVELHLMRQSGRGGGMRSRRCVRGHVALCSNTVGLKPAVPRELPLVAAFISHIV